MTRIFDNIELRLGEHLQATLQDFDRMDVAVGYFNLRGWSEFDEIVAAKDAELGMRPDDVDTVVGFLKRRKDGRRFNVQSSYRTFHFN